MYQIGKNEHIQLNDKSQILNYLKINQNLPIEFVVFSKAMSCKSIESRGIKNSEIYNSVRNFLSETKVENAALFEKKSNHDFLTICFLVLSQNVLDFINAIIDSGNKVNFVAWPLWIVSEYFQQFPVDRQKFKCSLFTVQTDDLFEIIVYTSNGAIFYRNSNILSDDQKKEISDTINYVERHFNISPEEVAIYSISDEVLKSFKIKSSIKTEIVCDKLDKNAVNANRSAKIIKLVFSCGLVIFSCSICNELFNISSLNQEIAGKTKLINSIDKGILSEIAIWSDIDYPMIKFVDFQALLKKYMQKKKLNKIQSLTMNVDQTSNNVEIQVASKTNENVE